MKHLAADLGEDGVEVVSIQGVGASCLEDRLLAKADLEALRASDTVVTLCCDVGSETLERSLPGVMVLNPVTTLGQGRREADGRLVVCRPSQEGLESGTSMEEACESLGCLKGSFRR